MSTLSAQNIAYFTFALIQLPIAGVLVVSPSLLAHQMFMVPLWENSELLVIIYDFMRLLGACIFFVSAFTLFMSTVQDRRSRNAFNLGVSLFGLLLTGIIIIYILLSNQHRWAFNCKVILTVYFLLVTFVFGWLWYSSNKTVPSSLNTSRTFNAYNSNQSSPQVSPTQPSPNMFQYSPHTPTSPSQRQFSPYLQQQAPAYSTGSPTYQTQQQMRARSGNLESPFDL